jgi:hypothetical protein
MYESEFQVWEMLFEIAIDVFQVDVKPKVEGDFFGEVISASLTIRCSHLKLLLSLERNGETRLRILMMAKKRFVSTWIFQGRRRSSGIPYSFFIY